MTALETSRELLMAVADYDSLEEVELAISNAKILAGLEAKGSDRAMCLMRLLALHKRRLDLSR